MTRKDYVLIAEAIRKEYDYYNTDAAGWTTEATREAARIAIRLTAYQLASSLLADNPRFDVDRFIDTALGQEILEGTQ